MSSEKWSILEASFVAVFSVAILLGFYQLLSMNGLVLGNDPAVHLEKSLIFLRTGQIPLVNQGWTPPLFEILLSVLIAFTNGGNIGQLIVIVKVAAALTDWLLIFSVYLLGSKFFGRRTGAVAALLLLICFPMYEANMFGGYTTVLALAFMLMVFLYTPLATVNFEYLSVTFFAAFGLVLSHQLATFLAVFIMPPFLLFMLIKSKGANLKVVAALILGGGIAFFLYYLQAMLPYLDLVIYYVFFGIKEYAYQIPSASFNSFMINFGFVFLLSAAGIATAYHQLKTSRKLVLYVILALSFFVPLFFAESYLFGLYLPFQWFIYYVMPPMIVLAAAATVFIFDKTLGSFYINNRTKVKKGWMKGVTVALVFLVAVTVLFRFGTVYGRIMEASVYYSTSDPKALEAGLWLKANFPRNVNAVVTDVPGFWFQLYSNETVIAATNPIVQRNEVAEPVLDMSYEVEQPFTLLRSYEAKSPISFENYVSVNNVWNLVSYASGDGDKVLYAVNGSTKNPKLTDFRRDMVFDAKNLSPKRLFISYVNDDLALIETITVRNDSYPTEITWTVTPLGNDISNVSLYVSIFFYLQFHFEKAYVPGVLNWANPWDNVSDSSGTDWAVSDFSKSISTDYVGFYSDKEDVVYALVFEQPPDWGNVGALSSRQIDAVRMQYNFGSLGMNQSISVGYRILTFSKNSFVAVPPLPIDLRSLFNFTPDTQFEVKSRDYHDYIKDNGIEFIVYDKNQLDTKIIRSKLLELIYSNNRYVIFRVKNDTVGL